ncbi:MAG: restriction endonuclease subunit S [Fluviicola sp.]
MEATIENKVGFKKTKLGWIPEDWEMVILNEFIREIKSGWSPKCPQEQASHGEWGSLKTSSITWDGYIPTENKKLPANLEPRSDIEVQKGDVLITRVGPRNRVGVVVWVDKDQPKLMLSDNMFGVKIKERIIPSFLALVLGTKKIQNLWNQQIAGLAEAQVVINQKTIKKTPIPLPSLPEQQKIATILSTWDKAIDKLSLLIAEKEALKKGLMQQLLTGKKRFPGFTDAWKEVKLGDAAIFRRGSFPQPYGLPEWYDDENGYPFVQVYDVDENMKLKPLTKRRISSLAADQSVFVERGTVVLTIQGSIGRIALTQYDSYVDRTLLIFTSFRERMDPVFFMYVVQELFEREKHRAPGGTIKTITKEKLTSFKILIASFEEQQKIASVLSVADKEIETLNNELNALKEQKRGLMQKLLTGQVRVKTE